MGVILEGESVCNREKARQDPGGSCSFDRIITTKTDKRIIDSNVIVFDR